MARRQRFHLGLTRAPVATAALLCLGAAALPSTPSTHAATEMRLDAREFSFTPSVVAAPPGDATFVVRNVGAIEHNFVVEDGAKHEVADIAIIEPGQTLRVRAVLGAGTYIVYCSLPGHREAGMVATLRVH